MLASHLLDASCLHYLTIRHRTWEQVLCCTFTSSNILDYVEVSGYRLFSLKAMSSQSVSKKTLIASSWVARAPKLQTAHTVPLIRNHGRHPSFPLEELRPSPYHVPRLHPSLMYHPQECRSYLHYSNIHKPGASNYIILSNFVSVIPPVPPARTWKRFGSGNFQIMSMVALIDCIFFSLDLHSLDQGLAIFL
jgi:hypothetical protein